MIYRLNQVPDQNYIRFLNLLGITRDPATPAHTYLTFTSGAGTVLVPAGTQAQTAAQQGQPAVVFETDEDVTVLPDHAQGRAWPSARTRRAPPPASTTTSPAR